MDHYFPSCKFTAAFPSVSLRVKEYAMSRGMEVMGCCRTDYEKSAPGERVLCVCTNCELILSEAGKGEPCSILEYIDEDPEFPLPALKGQRVVIQHCAKADAGLKRAVCHILERTGAEITVSAEENYCGVNFMRPMAKRNLDIAPKIFGQLDRRTESLSEEQQWQRVEEMIRRLPDGKIITYCNSCYAELRKHGAKVLHLMELLFP